MKVMDEAPPEASLKATPLFLAALLSAGAGLIHAAAAGSHNGDSTLALLFALTAAVQLGWAALAIAFPSREVAVGGAALNLALAGVWLITRIVGMPVIAVLSTVESASLQDSMAAALAVAAAAAAVWSIATSTPPEWLHRSSVAAIAAVLVVAVTVPAMAVGHEHDDHGDDSVAAGAGTDDEIDAQTVAFVTDSVVETDSQTATETGTESGAEGDEGSDDSEYVDEYGHAHDDAPITSLYDPRLTPEQREAARKLIDDTISGMERYPDLDAVIADGYISIGDGLTGFEHWVNVAYIVDGKELDPNAIESIVAKVNLDGSRQIVSAMYLMAPGSTMDDVPDIAGPLTRWHDHQDLCWEGARVTGRVRPDGSCRRGEFRATSPMLHVWLVPHPCGPFAGLEGHGGGCAHDH